MSKDLRQFLQQARKMGPDFYVEVSRPLKPKYEKDVLQLKLAKEGRYPVIFCPEIEGSRIPLVSNLYGSYELIGLALGMDATVVTESEVFREYQRIRHNTRPVKVVPATGAPVKEIILQGKDADLDLFPIQHHNELDSGKYIDIGCLICKDPDTGIPNVGVYRHEKKGKDKLGCSVAPTHHTAYIARRCAELGKPMEVAIFIGHHPAVVIGSQARGKFEMNEYEVMGGYLGEPLEVTPAETVDLLVPAYAEIVIEGTIDPHHMSTDAPFGEWHGYYGFEWSCYVIQVTAITMRRDAIYQDVAPSQREHPMTPMFGAACTVYDAVKSVSPAVKDVCLPFSGRGLATAYVSITKRVQGEGMRVGLAAVNNDVNTIRTAVVVDDDIDVYDEEEVQWAISTRVTPDIDILMLPRVAGCPLSPTSYDEERLKKRGSGGTVNTKMVIDATKPISQEFPDRVTPPKDLWNSMKLEDYIK